MSQELREFLFAVPFSGRILFNSGNDLAGVIASFERLSTFNADNKYFNKQATAVSYINRVIRDNHPVSPAMRLSILEAIAQRLQDADPKLREEVLARAERLMGRDAPSGRRAREEAEDDDPAIVRALELSEQADSFALIYTGAVGSVADLYMFREVLVKRLGLRVKRRDDGTFDEEDSSYKVPTASFTFYEPSEEYSLEGWRRLFYQVTGLSERDPELRHIEDPDEAAAWIEQLEASGHIRVAAVPQMLTGVPVIALDPMKSSSHVFVHFVYNFDSTNPKPRAIEMPYVYVENWKERVYKPLLDGRIPVTPVKFNAVKDQVLKVARELKKGSPTVPDPRLKWRPEQPEPWDQG